MIYWLHVVCSVLLRFIPRQVAYGLVSFFAPIGLLIWRQHYLQAVENMARILGPGPDPREVHRLVRNVFRNYAKYMVDLLRLPRQSFHELEQRLVVTGREHLEEALASGRGVVFVTGHIGNWDLAGALLASYGYPVNVIVETLQPKRWNDLVQEIRHVVGMRAIPLESGVRDILRALRGNEIIGILIDRPMRENGVPVEFFDALTRVPSGAATLALRTGANVMAAAMVRHGDRYVAHLSPVIRAEPSGDVVQDVQTLTQHIMDQLEQWIRQYPDQWFMFRDMWQAKA